MRPKQTAAARYTSAQTPDALLVSLTETVEPLDGGFTFVSKLSGGGIVIRVLRAPETERAWFGAVKDNTFRIALTPLDDTGTPYQPILRGTVTPDGSGSVIDLTLAPHPDARMFSILFTVGAVLLGAASLVAVQHTPVYGGLGLLMAVGFFVFPGFRAKVSFDAACETSLAALATQLSLQKSA